ncbi:hypothetical protein VCO01S_17350 [Vibrio comitans NBRC 102076]|uniref:GH16 domain-containing protein n=2 Tax=Vibrio comitans TaxID=413401 RepID=A0A4Y3IN76_9VIBR|nr:hypothetical protein VCO01S_17350 [Vibrio comitans NBRC 102076]
MSTQNQHNTCHVSGYKLGAKANPQMNKEYQSVTKTFNRISLASCIAIALAGCSSSSAPVQITPEQLVDNTTTPDTGWQMVWNDEFSGVDIDKSKWSFEENCWGGGNNEQQCYTDRKVNAFVDSGVLHIVAKKGSFTGPNNPDGDMRAKATLPYTSARLRTLNKGDWKYGRFEIRALMPSGQGTWPAIWMLPSDWKYGTWAASGEIDIMEAVNLKTPTDKKGAAEGTVENRIYGSLHYGRAWPENVHTGAEYTLPNNASPADGFHTYAIEWEEGEIRWYVDGVHYATQTQEGWYGQYKENGQLVTAPDSAPFNERFHLLLNLAVGGAWSGNTNEGGIDASAFPQTLAVDYVRVYQCSKDAETGHGCASVDEAIEITKGHETPKILVADANYGKGNLLEVFSEQLNPLLVLSGYDPEANINVSFVDDASKGKVLRIEKSGASGNSYFKTPEVDLSDWLGSGELVFDLFVESNPNDSELLVKIDSGWPKVSDLDVPLPDQGQWQEVRIKLSDLANGGNRFAAGNKVDMSKIINLLVIEPQGEMTLMMDNVRFER